MDDAILKVQGLSVRFGALAAVHDVHFEARRGHITSVIGPNGAGKSSLFNLISGAIRPSAGRVQFNGRDTTGFTPDQMVKAGLSRSFQITNLFFELTVRENLRLAAQFLEHGRGLFLPTYASERSNLRVEELLEKFSLQSRANELAGYLSHGEQRRLEIATALACDPEMLLLDEPTQGMSLTDTHETETLIRELACDNLSILLVEHDVDLVMNISNHVIVMSQGQKLAEGTPLDVRANSAVQAAYFGEVREQLHA
jgi:branched-chain amino acid transport system ATP-binding protein